jgi:D-sedoheptulose 7-phosphate isomerase
MTMQLHFEPDAIIGKYLQDFTSLMSRLDIGAVERVVHRLREARDAEATVFIAGNGGSASTASHWINDLGKAVKRSGQRPLRVHSLVDSVSWVTALGNDEGFERIFSGQLENFGRSGDVLILISASGNSPNLISAAELALSRKMDVIGLLGFDGGALKPMVTDAVWIETPAGEYGLVETGHVLVADLVTSCLMRDYAGA